MKYNPDNTEHIIEKIPCQINEGEYCQQPFCKYIYYLQLAEKAKWEWIQKCREELDDYKITQIHAIQKKDR